MRDSHQIETVANPEDIDSEGPAPPCSYEYIVRSNHYDFYRNDFSPSIERIKNY